MKRKIAAILAADVASYSRLVAEDEEDTLRRLAAYREVFDDFVVRAGGRIFNTAGDSVMCEFASAVEAVRCAIDIQESLRTRNMAFQPSRRLQFRIGISIGDVVERDGDLLGDGVNIAARLESLAEPGGICVSRSVHEAVANKVAIAFRDIGAREVKNIPQPVHAFVVAWPGSGGPDLPDGAGSGTESRPQTPERSGRRVATWVIGGGAATLIASAIGALWLRAAPPDAAPAVVGDEVRAHAPKVLPGDPAAAFAELARRGGLVPQPRTAAELYHNARLLEARGDTVEARAAYQRLAALPDERLDPHLRHAALLRVIEGRAGAREVYAALARRDGAPHMVGLVHALQFDGAERRRRVEAFAAAQPDYAPAQYLLAQEFAEDRVGYETLADKRAALAALTRFLAADAEGRLVPYFLDQSVLAEWLDDARRRHAQLERVLAATDRPPSASFVRSNAGWTVSLALPEAATAIAYGIGEGPFRSTGLASAVDQRTGKPIPMPSFSLPADQEATLLRVVYEDAAGRSIGPFAIAFDPAAALVSSQREILDRLPGAWLSLPRDNERLVYYTHLVSYRCAIAEVRVGYDGEPPRRPLSLPPCDRRDPYAIPADTRPYLEIGHGVRRVAAQITYADGTKSEVQEFRRE